MENIVDNEYELLKIQRLYNMFAKADYDNMLCCYGYCIGCQGDIIQGCLVAGVIKYKTAWLLGRKYTEYIITWLPGR